MKTKSLEALCKGAFILPTKALRQIKGGGETRQKTWCDHGDYQDMNGY